MEILINAQKMTENSSYRCDEDTCGCHSEKNEECTCFSYVPEDDCRIGS